MCWWDQQNIASNYVLSDTLGNGSFSVCRLARCKTCGIEVAVKSMSRHHDEFDEALIKAEADVMRRISHPSCTKLFAVVSDSSSVHFIQEFVPGGDLFARIFDNQIKISISSARTIIAQLVQATRYLHSVGICHRDLKPENIMMMARESTAAGYNDIKIVDFGLSTCEGVRGYEDCMLEICGTPDYCAPEMLALALRPEQKRPYSCKVDIWSIGAILYTILARATPFGMSGKHMKRRIFAVAEGKAAVRFPSSASFVPSTVQFISSCMDFDSARRPRAEDLEQLSFLAEHASAHDAVPSVVVAGREAPSQCHGSQFCGDEWHKTGHSAMALPVSPPGPGCCSSMCDANESQPSSQMVSVSVSSPSLAIHLSGPAAMALDPAPDENMARIART